ncbi:MAG: GtrA family protein [Candidatus Izemoplasmatales bacterium]|nr:GtrA family protein [Candidatus Izemoplasmatales bacterium]
MFKKIINFIVKNFLTRKFITFGIIGIINTGIHLLVYWLVHNALTGVVASDAWLAFLANTVAFVSASVFSYFANAIFTFKPQNRNTLQFVTVILVFLARLLISNGLTAGFDYIIVNWFNANYTLYPITKIIAPFMGSVLLIPIAYFALDYVFKKTGEKKPTNPEA